MVRCECGRVYFEPFPKACSKCGRSLKYEEHVDLAGMSIIVEQLPAKSRDWRDVGKDDDGDTGGAPRIR
ncbi:MAG: hypothetical protein ABR985_11100 [Methanotrichaceae archaeon]|jgi:hypothetical protein